MASRVFWLTAGVTTAAVLAAMSPASGWPAQTGGRYGQQSRSASVGPVTPSVIGSWQAHGADDFVVDNAPPNRPLPPPPTGRDWILDLMVLWRWPDLAPELSESSVGDEAAGSVIVHRLVAGDREFRVEFDPQAGRRASRTAASCS
jgi:hypothetical protein